MPASCDRYVPGRQPDCVEALWLADRLDDLLAAVDILVLCLPLNESTRGIIDAPRLAKMKPGGLLVNVARGPLVVTADLAAALAHGQLAGAVMDVTEPEPLPPRVRCGTSRMSLLRRTWEDRVVGESTT